MDRERAVRDSGTRSADEVLDRPRTKSSFLKQLPLREWGFEHCPAIPYWADAVRGSRSQARHRDGGSSLNGRGRAGHATRISGSSTVYTIDGQTAQCIRVPLRQAASGGLAAKDAGRGPRRPTSWRSTEPDEFTLSWTTYQDVYKDSQDLVAPFADTLTEQRRPRRSSFWPTIASFGLPYNLLVLAKVDAKRAAELASGVRRRLGGRGHGRPTGSRALVRDRHEHPRVARAVSSALDGTVRFTPGTVTVLKQDPQSKALTPIAIKVSTTDDAHHASTPDATPRGSMRSRRRRPRSRCGASGWDTSITGTSSRPRCR